MAEILATHAGFVRGGTSANAPQSGGFIKGDNNLSFARKGFAYFQIPSGHLMTALRMTISGIGADADDQTAPRLYGNSTNGTASASTTWNNLQGNNTGTGNTGTGPVLDTLGPIAETFTGQIEFAIPFSWADGKDGNWVFVMTDVTPKFTGNIGFNFSTGSVTVVTDEPAPSSSLLTTAQLEAAAKRFGGLP